MSLRILIYLFLVCQVSRTSTAEPTKTGIIWTADKDVSRFLPLFHQNNSRLMFDENNIVAGRYTGIFDTKLWGTFYTSTPHFPIPSLPDLIIPLSTKSETHSQMMNFPGDSTSNLITIPSNSAEAYVEILATGNGDEEFWYTNLPDELVEYFDEDSGILAKGPLREVQLLVDGLLGTSRSLLVLLKSFTDTKQSTSWCGFSFSSTLYW